MQIWIYNTTDEKNDKINACWRHVDPLCTRIWTPKWFLLSYEIFFDPIRDLVNHVAIVTQYTPQSLCPFVWVQPYQPARGWWVLSAGSEGGLPTKGLCARMVGCHAVLVHQPLDASSVPFSLSRAHCPATLSLSSSHIYIARLN